MSFSKDKMEASFDPSVTKKQSEGITSVKKKGLTYSQSSEKSHNSKYVSKMLHAKNKRGVMKRKASNRNCLKAVKRIRRKNPKFFNNEFDLRIKIAKSKLVTTSNISSLKKKLSKSSDAKSTLEQDRNKDKKKLLKLNPKGRIEFTLRHKNTVVMQFFKFLYLKVIFC